MRTAICLFGRIGNITGKSGSNNIGSDKVLKLSFKHWNEYIIKNNDNVDFFIHSWNTDLRDKIDKLFKPKASLYEEQIKFKIPKHVRGEYNRKQSHYSRWYSTMKSIELERQYAQDYNAKYGCVMSARFDIAWKKPIIFNEHNMKFFYCGGWYNQSERSIKDFWFFSNQRKMNRFGELFYKISDYMRERGKFGKAISNHKLAKYHLDTVTNKIKYLLRCDHNTDPDQSDYPLIRYQYFGTNE
jgi:hypothetical protein